jgi:hypothetical protein
MNKMVEAELLRVLFAPDLLTRVLVTADTRPGRSKASGGSSAQAARSGAGTQMHPSIGTNSNTWSGAGDSDGM